ncbi:delta-lactam-biosynthetic de-N-acetylase [Clostridium sp. JN-9]|uniref:delta-lactam-biosynthetic de-N-acetylase n=1 Tax=Clostridium sp. JN-9 TaxID=2507159 RepID=UPI000FFE2157|nr:delta-lactam-biosynthetic de-N-acetylase [Clostridium sp. JN-9]QAT39469.1 delta-lactam-biosynthetic de-N-acetylase [Clostridium sp. JN-9]
MIKKLILPLIIFTLILSACSGSPKSINTSTNITAPLEIDKDNNTAPPVKKAEENNSIKDNTSSMDTKELDWFFQPRNDGTPSGEPKEVLDLINKYSAYYLGDTSKKYMYLTFDEGYENGYTSKILDILKENNVKAAFFVTTPYINSNKDLIKRMVNEGHLVCNHSTHHPSMAAVAKKDKSKFVNEFAVNEKAFEEVTGKKMVKFFRPPMGKYSELSLAYTKELGYKSIFWSFAYGDWDIKKQPSEDYAKKVIMQRTHNGSIVLLHAVSKTNTNILDSILKYWKSSGYELKSLTDLPDR